MEAFNRRALARSIRSLVVVALVVSAAPSHALMLGAPSLQSVDTDVKKAASTYKPVSPSGFPSSDDRIALELARARTADVAKNLRPKVAVKVENKKRETSSAMSAVRVQPTSPLKKLLSLAKEEASRHCRKTASGMLCRKGTKRVCLQAVRMVLQRMFGENTDIPWTTKAKDAGPFLEKYGYKKAPKGRLNEINAPAGAVLVYDSPKQPSHAGHIEIRGDDGYYSDYFSAHPITKVDGAEKRRLIAVYLPSSR